MSQSLSFTKPDDSFIEHLGYNMRASDKREVWLSTEHTPCEALREAFGVEGKSKVALFEGEPIAAFGVAKFMDAGMGTPWFLCTDGVYNVSSIEFALQSRRQLAELSEGFKLLENYVLASNETSVRWLEWLGFVVDEPQTLGPFNASFRRFWKHV